MALFANFLVSVFGGLFTFFASYFTKKVAVGAAVSATLLAVTVAFYATVRGLVNGLAFSITNEWLLMGFWSILPSNFVSCITIIFAAEVAAFLYRHQLMTIKAVSSVN